jgi:hypothetical protein
MSPIVDAWADDAVPMQDYAAGSAGPQPLPPAASAANGARLQ